MGDECGAISEIRISRGNQNTRRKPAPSATMSTTNPTWLDVGSNPGRRGGKPATSRLSYDSASLLRNWDSSPYVSSLQTFVQQVKTAVTRALSADFAREVFCSRILPKVRTWLQVIVTCSHTWSSLARRACVAADFYDAGIQKFVTQVPESSWGLCRKMIKVCSKM
jgi:hypothetical protein